MTVFTYDRSAVPIGEKIRLEVVFTDSASNSKNVDTTPTLSVIDAASAIVLATTGTGVVRTAEGIYRYDLIVPAGFTSGIWNDVWTAVLDGYSVTNVFNFTVNSVGAVATTGASVPEVIHTLESPDLDFTYTQEEIKGILLLRGRLKNKLRNQVFKPDGSSCPIFADTLLNDFLCCALAELNATPTFTAFSFADNIIQTLALDLMTQGAMLVAWSSQAIIEAGLELTVSDDGVTVNPPPVSSMISSMYNTNLTDYRAKLKEFKHNMRPGPKGLSSGNFVNVRNPRVSMLRHRRELRLY